MNTAPGIDGLSTRDLKAIPLEILHRIVNIFLLCKRIPPYLLKSKTILIPKKKGASEPGDFRPITISSVITRLFHKILGNRLRLVKIDERQRAFGNTDGCSENIFLLDLVIRHQREKLQQLFLASTDIAKAFDSVAFEALREVMKKKGLPDEMVEYIMYTYELSTTRLQHGDWESDDIHPTCGVKQGDPMSQTLFNFIIDVMLAQIPGDIGVHIGNLRVNIMAFADDLIVMASSKVGLQELLNIVSDFLLQCGLTMNAGKCRTIAYRNVPKAKQIAIDAKCFFTIGGTQVPAMNRIECFKYLGVPITPEGRILGDIKGSLHGQLTRLSRAPLKPQQRLWIVSNILIPSLMYQLTTGKIQISMLRTLDRDIRRSIRDWLRLPHDSPIAYIHASTNDGGLGIPSLRWITPLQRKAKLNALLKSTYISDNYVSQFIKDELVTVERRLQENGTTAASNVDINRRWATVLHNMHDGAPLKKSHLVPQQHDWVKDGTCFLSGKDYINLCKLRIAAIPTKARTARGRFRDRSCRAGCLQSETLNHVLQQCHRTHGKRIERHDAIVNYVSRSLTNLNYRVFKEVTLPSDEGPRKPDIIAHKENQTLVLDVQVVSEQSDLTRADALKVSKYRENISLMQNIAKKFGTNTPTVYSLTINSRGVWSHPSADRLLRDKIIKSKDLKVISTRTLIGGMSCINFFNSCTSRSNGMRWRTGVG